MVAEVKVFSLYTEKMMMNANATRTSLPPPHIAAPSTTLSDDRVPGTTSIAMNATAVKDFLFHEV